jgi:hypothetical protein
MDDEAHMSEYFTSETKPGVLYPNQIQSSFRSDDEEMVMDAEHPHEPGSHVGPEPHDPITKGNGTESGALALRNGRYFQVISVINMIVFITRIRN